MSDGSSRGPWCDAVGVEAATRAVPASKGWCAVRCHSNLWSSVRVWLARPCLTQPAPMGLYEALRSDVRAVVVPERGGGLRYRKHSTSKGVRRPCQTGAVRVRVLPIHGHRTYRRDMNRCRCTCYHRIGCVKRVFCEVHINRVNIFICSSYSSSDLRPGRDRGARRARGGPRGTPARVKAAYKRSSSQLDSGTRPTETHDRRRQELEPCPRRQSTKIQAGPGALCLLRAGCLGADPSRASLVPCAAPH